MIKEIKVPNLTFKIKKHNYSSIDDSYGTTDRDKQIINVQSGLTPELERITLMHEMLHALELNTGIKYCEEQQIEQFAHNLFFVLKNNPELVSYLLE
jgi:Zn-dependent peptidase ImmA (M78 family)